MELSRRTFAIAGALALGAGLPVRAAWAGAPAAIRRLTVAQSAGAARVSLSLDRAASPRSFFLDSPDRFVIDVPDAVWALPEGACGQGPGTGVVRGYRYAPRPQDRAARLVLDLAGPADIVRREGGAELSFDLAPRGMGLAPAAPALEMQGRSAERRIVVVDAGHGGRDPGAIGRTGVREKDVVLDAALNLRSALEARGAYRVALTRDADVFVPLEDRVRFARAQGADLFISLHADSHANREAQGASVYTLSERGANRAQNIMAAQNWEIDLGEAPREGVVGDILVDLAQRETTNRSAQFAEAVIANLAPAAPLLRNTHRSAGFFVLLAPDVPAVLIETGFLSNLEDERRLSDPRRRADMAEAMARSVDAYFTRPQLYVART